MFGCWKGGGGTCMSNFDGDLSNQRIDQYRIALTFKKKKNCGYSQNQNLGMIETLYNYPGMFFRTMYEQCK